MVGEARSAMLLPTWRFSMSQTRAADDFKTIRERLEELRRERAVPPVPEAVARGRWVSGHRGPCACGMSLFPDECDGNCKLL
jgi:hypothetical protein